MKMTAVCDGYVVGGPRLDSQRWEARVTELGTDRDHLVARCDTPGQAIDALAKWASDRGMEISAYIGVRIMREETDDQPD